MNKNLAWLLGRVPACVSITPRPVIQRTSTLLWSPPPALIQGATRNYAARAHTRAKKEKLKQKNKAAKKEKEAVSKDFKQQLLTRIQKVQVQSLFPKNESEKPVAVDNVYFSSSYKWPCMDVLTAIKNFKEVHHPTMFDNPKALVKAYFELDLSTKKKTQFMDRFAGVVEVPHVFETGKPIRTVCLFCKDKNLIEAALAAGANAAVGLEGIKMFQEGALDFEDYDIILAHPDILTELAPIRGLIIKKFPNIKRGTVGFDVVSLVNKFKRGVDYEMNPSILNPRQGLVQTPIGTVDMPASEIEKNFVAVLDAVSSHKLANMSNAFFTGGAITSEFSNERFKVSLDPYLTDSDEDIEKEEPAKGVKTAAVNA
ncbi:50S ribosomal protein L1 [Thrips palmi]|uniref:50S ribosomal protein L1 n=1 Tax=Thrips palmi TaxID=161013 RepID=A0A6P8ZYA7_THRPL|nr:50S ribosomal protein L1 [Thrips palmi]